MIITSTAAELGASIAARELSAVEVTQAHLDRIAEVDGKVHAFLHVDRARALARRRRSMRSSPRARRSVHWRACRWRSRTC